MPSTAILGATGTIGSTLARHLVKNSRPVLLVGRDEEKLAELGQELDQPCAVVDFSRSQSLQEALQEYSNNLGGIINCIGSMMLKPAHLTSDDEFREVLETNLFTSFSAIYAGGKLLRSQGGTIVLFASAAAEIGIHNHEAISAAKAGIIGLARAAAATYAAYNIRVNVISPGLVKTELSRAIWHNPTSAEASMGLHPLGRLGEPQDVVSLATWLLDPQNSWITGQVIGLDGGLSNVLPRRRMST